MLTYTFSMREKVMLAVLAFVVIGILWYQFVFMNIQNQITTINAQIASAQDELVIAQSQAAALQQMQAKIDEYQAQGVKAITMPDFDNTQNLMAYLNSVLSGTRGYSMSFEDPTMSEEDNMVHRSGTITFSSTSYEEARSVVESIAHGPYPCHIDAMGIADSSVGSTSSSSNDSPVTTNLQVTYLEKPTGNMVVKTEDNIPEGNDWSQYMNN